MNIPSFKSTDLFYAHQTESINGDTKFSISKNLTESVDTSWEKLLALGMLKEKVVKACSEGFAEKLLYEAEVKIQNDLLNENFFAKFSPKENSLEMKNGFLSLSRDGRAEFQYRGLLANKNNSEESQDNNEGDKVKSLPFELFPSTLDLLKDPFCKGFETLSSIRKNFGNLARKKQALLCALKEVEWLESEPEIEMSVPKFGKVIGEVRFKSIKISLRDFPEHMRQACLKELNITKLELQTLLQTSYPEEAKEEFNKSIGSLSLLKTVNELRYNPNSCIHETLIVPTREALKRVARPEEVRAVIEAFKKKLQVLIADVASVDEESEAITSSTVYAKKVERIASLISKEALNNIAFALQIGATEELILGGKLGAYQAQPLSPKLKEKLQCLDDSEDLQIFFDRTLENAFSGEKNLKKEDSKELFSLIVKILSGDKRTGTPRLKFERSKEENTSEHGTARGLLNGSDELSVEMVRIIKEGFDSAFLNEELMISGFGFVPFAKTKEEQERLEAFLDTDAFKKANIIGTLSVAQNKEVEISPAVLSRAMFLFYRHYKSHKKENI